MKKIAFFLIILLFSGFTAITQVNCTKWLLTPTQTSYVRVGDVDVTGNQLTVEAEYNRTVPFNNVVNPGNLVSKHTGANNLNYALSPTYCEITTDISGYKAVSANCTIDLNKTYHVAMVYDGNVLKYYRNGFLLAQIPCTGNLINNDLETTISQIAGNVQPFDNQFRGYVNEVRIWNVARTQAQLRTYMNTSLPSPTTQPGLLAYYTFDNLLNKQGNTAYNGALFGPASINQTNTNCSFVADSCNVIVSSPIVINDYSPVVALSACDNKLTVEDGVKFNPGDTVLLIQMKGATIDSSNTAAFGSITDYKSAGNYEFNYVKSRIGNIVELKNKLTRSYEIPVGKVQLIRVPYYQNVTFSSTLTCLPWDGSRGGVLVFNVKDTINLNADINVKGKGFMGGGKPNLQNTTTACFTTDFAYPAGTVKAAEKGESIYETGSANSCARAPNASGGGGGNGHNSGGGGGGNAGGGGMGGYQLLSCGNAPFDNRGLGGRPLNYTNAANKLFLGGGGGGGHTDNANGIDMKGGNGGGIVIINAGYLKGNGYKIIANGDAGQICNNALNNCHDGNGGGGGGGAIALSVNNFTDLLKADAAGGKGADLVLFVPPGGPEIGPGGGGGGGVLWVKSPSLPAFLTPDLTGGTNGVILQNANDPWGATPGLPGTLLYNLIIPFDTIPFKPNIDSVRIKDSLTACKTFNFKGLAYTNTSAIAHWQWYFGDGSTANSQNTSHTYLLANTTYTLKLVVTDINGCKDSVTKNITTLLSVAEAGADTSFCTDTAASVALQASGGTVYSWSPAGLLNNSTIANPTATVNSTTKFYVTVTTSDGCTGLDSVTVFIKPLPQVKTLNDTALCKNSFITLITTGATSYAWHPGNSLSDSATANPIFTANQNQQLIVTGTNAVTGCKANDTINITVNSLPLVKTIPDTTICNAHTITLTTTGSQAYQWDPAVFLSNPGISSPVFTGTTNQTYEVTGTDANGCKAKDTVVISFAILDDLLPPPDTAMCRQQSVTLRGNSGPGYHYAWSPSTNLSNAFVENPVCNAPATTTYILTISEPACNLQKAFNVTVTVHPLPVITATSQNDIDCASTYSNLSATGALNYVWSPSTGLSNFLTSNPVAAPASTTLYTVTGTDINGCIGNGSVQVKVLPGGKDFTEIPNSFTPNGDGLNDCFGPGRFWRNTMSLEFMVYDRWGERIFYSTNPNACWNGTFKGVKAKEGAYVYYLTATTLCGKIEKKGNVILIR
jgi:gliding motility-associated-like protein